jgi:glycosyltransferase involved in cell wall biosynthesis
MSDKKLKKIVIIPVYNEENTVLDVLSACENKVDIFVIVNDGSVDRSMAFINEWRSGKDNVHVIQSGKNHGMSWAVKEGFNFIHRNFSSLGISDNDIVIQVDADAQHSIEDIEDLIDYMTEKKIDYLITRRDFKGYPLLKRIGNKLMSAFVSLITFKRFHDIESGYRVMKARVISPLLQYTVGFKYSWAQEMTVICSRLGFIVDNEWKTRIRRYRKRGTRIHDAFINCFFSAIVLPINFMLKDSAK